MKKRNLSLLTAVTLLIVTTMMLAACVGGREESYPIDYAETNTAYMAEAPVADSAYGGGYYEYDKGFGYDGEYYGESSMAGAAPGDAGFTNLSVPITGNLAEKIIYTYNAEIETLRFEDTIAQVESLITAHGAFVESSNIRGTNYSTYVRGGVSYRSAYFSIRVPVEQLNSVISKLGNLGNVISQNSNAQNITAQFTDTEAKLTSLRIQEERLLDMLSKAEDIPDLLTIESRLSEIRYQIESVTSMLLNWQRQVDYSTLTLSITEVEEYREIIQPEPDKTYRDRMSEGIQNTLSGLGGFFKELFLWVMINAPILLILTIIAVIVIKIVQICKRRSKKRREEKQQQYANAYAAQYNQPVSGTPIVPAGTQHVSAPAAPSAASGTPAAPSETPPASK